MFAIVNFINQVTHNKIINYMCLFRLQFNLYIEFDCDYFIK